MNIKNAKAKKGNIYSAFEEAWNLLIDAAQSSDDPIQVIISDTILSYKIALRLKGEPLESDDVLENAIDALKDEDPMVLIRNAQITLIRAHTDSFNFSSKNGVNQIVLSKTKRQFPLINMLISIGGAIVVGLLLKNLVSAEFSESLNNNLFVPIRKMFINALKMAAVPVVFFSLSSCIAGFSNLKSLGRIGLKVMGSYIATTLIAIGIGMGITSIIKPGSPAVVADVTKAVIPDAQISILDMIVNIVPSNFINAFGSAEMLQVMFLAIIIGIGAGKISDNYNSGLKDALKHLNDLFLWITSAIVSLAPLAVFCGITSLVLTTGFEAFVSLCMYLLTFLVSLICMMSAYLLIIVIFGHMNPFTFFRKYFPSMIASFSLSSSNASIPVNIAACTDELGVNPKVAAFSIPLGATVNMDGSSIYLVVSILFLAKSFGLAVSPSMLLGIGVSALIFSIGQPGVTGGGFVCLSALATQVGLPVDAISILVGIDPIMSMFRTCSNCTGDAAVTVTVANSEGQLDKEKYNSFE